MDIGYLSDGSTDAECPLFSHFGADFEWQLWVGTFQLLGLVSAMFIRSNLAFKLDGMDTSLLTGIES